MAAAIISSSIKNVRNGFFVIILCLIFEIQQHRNARLRNKQVKKKRKGREKERQWLFSNKSLKAHGRVSA
jgi:hypothetical protein